MNIQNQPSQPPPRKINRFWMIGGISIVLAIMAVVTFLATQSKPAMSLDQLTGYLQDQRVQSITVYGGTDVSILLDNGEVYSYTKEREVDLLQQLQVAGITSEQLSAVEYREQQGDNSPRVLFQFLVVLLPLLLFVGVVLLLLNHFRVGKQKNLPVA